jgi:hypothetical protein
MLNGDPEQVHPTRSVLWRNTLIELPDATLGQVVRMLVKEVLVPEWGCQTLDIPDAADLTEMTG